MSGTLATVLATLSPVLMAALGWVSVRLAQWIASKTRNEALSGILIRAEEAVTTSVQEIAQVYTDNIKAGGARLTEDQAKVAKDRAIEKAKSYLGPAGMSLLASVLGMTADGIHAYLAGKVEATVRAQGIESAAVDAKKSASDLLADALHS